MKTFAAPWGRILWITSLLVTAVCIGVSVTGHAFVGGLKGFGLQALCWAPLIVPVACVPFVVRSYTITPEAILIKRLWWDTRYERAQLKSAEAIPHAMKGSIRTCGNGGAFSFTGWYWSRKLGVHRAFVNDLKRTVVLRFRMRTIVVSPDDPEGFVAALEAGGG